MASSAHSTALPLLLHPPHPAAAIRTPAPPSASSLCARLATLPASCARPALRARASAAALSSLVCQVPLLAGELAAPASALLLPSSHPPPSPPCPKSSESAVAIWLTLRQASRRTPAPRHPAPPLRPLLRRTPSSPRRSSFSTGVTS
ncbi:hypothetical protein FA09DRAFT_65384 [Tilletiopsis washingtonensis]|uniref:Uncharacterized protein n=1 Tax=Tilletiopsis washingtonensis TaxID=58919 RepID=A0A316Z7H8_9BASI|nr:hypothetical protein FA09DRAFT_65384 [Tilletiopsis washingtonensis]PWN97216.1 hypothetical protein FA09DRAFT_65384 [Tilletiopsis washingtonensis]